MIEESSAPPIIRLDEKPEVSFADLDEVFDTENPDGSDIVAGETREPSPGLEFLDGDAMPIEEGDMDDLEKEGVLEPLDGYDVLV